MLWGEFRGEGGGVVCVVFNYSRIFFRNKSKKKKNCILNIQYSIDRDKKKLEILSRFMYFLF